mmetsp:Transcript_113237/g.316390  ORF Transcript_113237/g.316390 Transcript_113237/m.316390 type:complete len:200 (-) Transcript_113237:2-601(-)
MAQHHCGQHLVEDGPERLLNEGRHSLQQGEQVQVAPLQHQTTDHALNVDAVQLRDVCRGRERAQDRGLPLKGALPLAIDNEAVSAFGLLRPEVNDLHGHAHLRDVHAGTGCINGAVGPRPQFVPQAVVPEETGGVRQLGVDRLLSAPWREGRRWRGRDAPRLRRGDNCAGHAPHSDRRRAPMARDANGGILAANTVPGL